MRTITNVHLFSAQSVRDYLYFVPEYDADSEFVAIEKVLRECGVKSPGYLVAVLMEKGLRVKR